MTSIAPYKCRPSGVGSNKLKYLASQKCSNRRSSANTAVPDEPRAVAGRKGRTGMTHPHRLSMKAFLDGLSGRNVRPRDTALFLQHRMACEASLRAARLYGSGTNLTQERPLLAAPSGRPRYILAADQHDAALSSRTPVTRDARPPWTICVVDAEEPPRPVRINIMSAARSQPDRIGPLCPIPNQSSPCSVTASAAASQL